MLKVYGVELSPFVRKVLLTLELKGVPYELVPTFPSSTDEAFRTMSPLGKIPALDHDGFQICDSSVICHYLDQLEPSLAIYPTDAKEQARACWFEELGDSKLMDCCGAIFQERLLKPRLLKEETDEAKVENIIQTLLPPLLTYLESQVSGPGPLVGDSITIGDISIISCFAQAEYGKYEVLGSEYPKLRAYLDWASGLEVLKARLASEKASLAALIS